MTPKEKAKELQLKYYVNIPLNCLMLDENLSKKMALIAVDELIEHLQPASDFGGEINKYTIEYWQEVKQEIEKL